MCSSDLGRRKPPYVHTKQGVSMLSAVLKSEVAVRASVQIIRAFVEMRHLIAVPCETYGNLKPESYNRMTCAFVSPWRSGPRK